MQRTTDRARSANPQLRSTVDRFSGGEVITSRCVRTRQGEWMRIRAR
jgi:hypothetical protein